MASNETVLLDAGDIERALSRVALQIIEETRGRRGDLALIGIREGGLPIATQLAGKLTGSLRQEVRVGSLEISLYRDDAAIALPDAKLGTSLIEFEVEGRDVVLVDDVLHTGRTVRAAITGLLDYGRPRRIWLAVLCDRGGRELPISADFVGREVAVPDGYVLHVIAQGTSEDCAILRPKR
jgi:pyrimidine operon attenuation protein/uracil phosphoribosyltransferase